MRSRMIRRHNCRVDVIGVKTYDRPGGGHTVTTILQRCRDCGTVCTTLAEGTWTLAEITAPPATAAATGPG